LSEADKEMTKLFQYDKKVWDDGDTDHTWQFGIINNKTLLWVNYETPGRIIHSSGGINVLFTFFGGCLFSVDIQQRIFCLAVGFFTEYLEGWND
jgi:hypothetical protein